MSSEPTALPALALALALAPEPAPAPAPALAPAPTPAPAPAATSASAPVPIKSGSKTTEFWLSVTAIVVSSLLASGVLHNETMIQITRWTKLATSGFTLRLSNVSITDLYPAGSIDEKQWQVQLEAAKQATTIDERTRAYLVLYADVANLVQASRVIGSSTVHVVTNGALTSGVTPGLNLALTLGPDGPNGRTGYVDALGRFGVKLSLDPAAAPLGIAIAMFPDAFANKMMALVTLRHELEHFQHFDVTLQTVRAWQAGAANRGKGPTARAEFVKWLGSTHDLKDWEKVLVGEVAGLPQLISGKSIQIQGSSSNTEILAYVEGFMTIFHLLDPKSTSLNQHLDYLLLPVIEKQRWASADKSVRAQALDRLQEYYCHTLDSKHRDIFDRFVSSQLSVAISDDDLRTFGAGRVDEATLLRKREFFFALRAIVDGKCKGFNPSMKL